MSGLLISVQSTSRDGFTLDVNTELPARGVCAIYGPSGSGKSTLLESIAGLRSPELGSLVSFRDQLWLGDGVSLPPWQRNIGFVFQDARLFPHLTVQQNLRYPLDRLQRKPDVTLEQAVDWFELEQLLARSVATLSAGQQQRVAMARAILSSPRLLLLDEPMANLDKAARRHCMKCLLRLKDTVDLPMLYVSHDMEEVSQLADTLVLMRDGKIEAQGSLLELSSRLDTRLSHEEQAASIVVGELKRQDEEFGLSELDVGGQVLYVNRLSQPLGTKVRLRIPARDVSISRQKSQDSSILNILPVAIEEIETTTNTRALLRLSFCGQYLLARITRKSAIQLKLQRGDRVYAQIKSVALLSQSENIDL